MPQIGRKSGDVKAMGINAAGTDRTVFGQAGLSDTLDGNVTPEFLTGWGIVTPPAKPPRNWFNAVGFTAMQYIAYLHQVGMADWDAGQEYYVNGHAVGSDGKIYRSKTGAPNVGNDPISDPVNWETASATDFQDKLFGGTPSSGYQIFPGGLIIQWGNAITVSANGNAGTSHALPITFPNAFFQTVCTDVSFACASAGAAPNGTGAIRVWAREAGNGSYANIDLRFLAIGH